MLSFLQKVFAGGFRANFRLAEFTSISTAKALIT
jgi:hypothetical protein